MTKYAPGLYGQLKIMTLCGYKGLVRITEEFGVIRGDKPHAPGADEFERQVVFCPHEIVICHDQKAAARQFEAECKAKL